MLPPREKEGEAMICKYAKDSLCTHPSIMCPAFCMRAVSGHENDRCDGFKKVKPKKRKKVKK